MEKLLPSHEQLSPTHEQLSSTHVQLSSIHEQLSTTHEQLSPTHEQLSPATSCDLEEGVGCLEGREASFFPGEVIVKLDSLLCGSSMSTANLLSLEKVCMTSVFTLL
jgi:hypothetical protein